MVERELGIEGLTCNSRVRRLLAVVCQKGMDEAASSERADEGQLAHHDGCSNQLCQALGVLSWIGRVGTLEAEDIEHG